MKASKKPRQKRKSPSPPVVIVLQVTFYNVIQTGNGNAVNSDNVTTNTYATPFA